MFFSQAAYWYVASSLRTILMPVSHIHINTTLEALGHQQAQVWLQIYTVLTISVAAIGRFRGKTKSVPLRWRHNGRDGVSNNQPHYCLLNRLFRRRSMKTSKLRVTGLRVGNSPGTSEFPAQMASNAENVSISWRRHDHALAPCVAKPLAAMVTGDPLHSRALAHSRAPLFTQPCSHCSHSRAPGEQWARLCVFTLHGCVQAARLCRGSPVMVRYVGWMGRYLLSGTCVMSVLIENANIRFT